MHALDNWNDFLDILKGRDIYIYGGNVEGVGISRMLSANNQTAKAFIDTRTFNNGFLRGTPIIHPEHFEGTPSDSIVIICTKHRESRANARQFCIDRKYIEANDFLFNSSLCQFFPTIETVGICNLRCFTCDMGIPKANHNQKMMEIGTFTKVLTKLKAEIPFLNSVALYLWGEPLLHPQIGDLIRLCHEHGLATEFSTNLNNIHYLDYFIKADPDILIVTSSGFGKNYEITHTGGNFEKFKMNCQALRKTIDKYQVETFVKYHYLVYNNNGGAEMAQAQSFAEDLHFQFIPIMANIFPGKIHDHVVLGESLPDIMVEANKYLLYDIHDQIRWAQHQKHKPCPVIKAFPTIRWDGKVMHCCNMTKPFVGENYLTASLGELLTLRENSGFCQRCQTHGIHRVFDVNGREESRMSQILQKLNS